MRRCLPACLPACLTCSPILLMLFLLWPAVARSTVGIPAERQIAATRVGTSDWFWRIWAVRSDAHLVTVHRNNGPWIWTDRLDCGSAPAATSGVTATWWNDGVHQHERAFYLGVDGNIYEYALIDGGSATCTKLTLNKPASAFTGNLTALNGVEGASRYRYIFATTADGKLWKDRQNVSSSLEYGWSTETGWTSFATNRPLTSTVNAAGTIYSVFVVRSGDALTLIRYDGTWSRTNISGAGAPVCGSIAAAQGRLSATEYWIGAFCTSTTATDTVLRFASAASETTRVFNWGSVAVPGGASLDDLGFTVAAIDRPAGGGYVAIDAHALGTNDHVYRFTKVAGSAMTGADRGQTGEGNSSTDGGMAAVRNGPSNHSRAVFTGSLGNANYLYTRAGLDTATWSWEALGAGVPIHHISGIDPGDRTRPHTESMIAEWNGRVMAASIVRGGPSPQETDVDFAWSEDDGYTWGPQTKLDEHDMDYVTDPQTVFTNSGRAYIIALGVDFPAGCGAPPTWTKIWYRTSTDGASFTDPVEIAAVYVPNDLDHPWVAIDRTRTPNRLHFTWSDIGFNTVLYRYLDDSIDGTGFSQQDGVNGSTVGGASTIAVDSTGKAFVAWRPAVGSDQAVRICPIWWDPGPPAHFRCSPVLALAGELEMDGADVLVPGTSYFLKQDTGWSIQASRTTPGRIYYAYQRRETNAPAPPDPNEKDVYLAILDYNGSTWTPGAPVAVTVTNDDRDQFNPAINVDYGGTGYESMVVSWYDRREDCAGRQNYCIRRKRAYSSTGLIFLYLQDSQRDVPLTDPVLLPRHCKNYANRLFIGDYQEGQGGGLHSHHIWSWAPEGWSPPAVPLSQGFLSAGGFYY